MKVICSNCKAYLYEVDDSNIGRVDRCTMCGEIFNIVKEPVRLISEDPEEHMKKSTRLSESGQKNSAFRPKHTLFLVFAAMLIGIFTWMMMSHEQRQPNLNDSWVKIDKESEAPKADRIIRWRLRSGDVLELEANSDKIKDLIHIWFFNEPDKFFSPIVTDKEGNVIVPEGITHLARPDETKFREYEQVKQIIQQGYSNDVEEAKLFLKENTDVNARDEYGKTPLHRAKSKEVATLLLNAGADINAKDDFYHFETPLHTAAYEGRKDVVELLLDKGANVNVKDRLGTTPLHKASSMGHLAVVKLLLSKGADVNAKSEIGGFTPLSEAIHSRNKEIVTLLLDRGAHINTDDWTALHGAVLNYGSAPDVEIVELLISKGADVNAKSSKGSTALHLAASSGSLDVVRLLLKAGADVNVKDKDGLSPLRTAIEKSHHETADLLRKHGGK